MGAHSRKLYLQISSHNLKVTTPLKRLPYLNDCYCFYNLNGEPSGACKFHEFPESCLFGVYWILWASWLHVEGYVSFQSEENSYNHSLNGHKDTLCVRLLWPLSSLTGEGGFPLEGGYLKIEGSRAPEICKDY